MIFRDEDSDIELCKQNWVSSRYVDLDLMFYTDFVGSLNSLDPFYRDFMRYNWTPEVESEIRKRWRIQNSKLGRALK